jgi:hypothetical protein
VSNNHVRALLAEAVAADPKGKAGVAARLGVSRPLIARVLSDNAPLDVSDKLAALVASLLTRFVCPHLKTEITPAQCAAYAGRAVPTSNTREVRHWKTCQTCPHKPTQGVAK